MNVMVVPTAVRGTFDRSWTGFLQLLLIACAHVCVYVSGEGSGTMAWTLVTHCSTFPRDDLTQLSFTTLCIKESLRQFPPVTLIDQYSSCLAL